MALGGADNIHNVVRNLPPVPRYASVAMSLPVAVSATNAAISNICAVVNTVCNIINTAPKISAALESVRRWFWGLAPNEEDQDGYAALKSRRGGGTPNCYYIYI
ncbi:hypothetical protein CI102_12876 [Trichoderma harzianum]|nr:hypothetical protein CI102_12876 [Trichoderma harzianum]